jgi:hypothetical protein
MIAVGEPDRLEGISKGIRRCRGEPHIVNVDFDGVKTRRLG